MTGTKQTESTGFMSAVTTDLGFFFSKVKSYIHSDWVVSTFAVVSVLSGLGAFFLPVPVALSYILLGSMGIFGTLSATGLLLILRGEKPVEDPKKPNENAKGDENIPPADSPINDPVDNNSGSLSDEDLANISELLKNDTEFTKDLKALSIKNLDITQNNKDVMRIIPTFNPDALVKVSNTDRLLIAGEGKIYSCTKETDGKRVVKVAQLDWHKKVDLGKIEDLGKNFYICLRTKSKDSAKSKDSGVYKFLLLQKENGPALWQDITNIGEDSLVTADNYKNLNFAAPQTNIVFSQVDPNTTTEQPDYSEFVATKSSNNEEENNNEIPLEEENNNEVSSEEEPNNNEDGGSETLQ